MVLTKKALQRELYTRELASREYAEFVTYVNKRYDMKWFHRIIAEHLDSFEKGDIKRLMITMPPQHGKSELSTRNFPPYLFGKNPDRKIAVLSYSADKARKFSREIQQRLGSDEYWNLFPEVRLATAKDEAMTRTMTEFDIVGYLGSLKAVGRRGSLTGDPVDIVIMDDLLKDEVEAQSPHIREQAWGWIESVVDTRLHNDSQMLYVTTRWHEDDPAGRFLDQDGYYSDDNPDGWVLINFAALRTHHQIDYDPREEGEALWPEKHSQARMEKKRKDSPLVFNALYQGDPKPSEEALIFSDWIQVDEMPEDCDYYFNGLDFGYSNDPTALYRIGRSGKKLYVDEYLYETELTNPDILERFHLASLDPDDETICDKAEPKSIEELKRGSYDRKGKRLAGINAKGCDKGPGSINAGISKLKEFTVHYTRRSRNLEKELARYSWIMANGKATNKPIEKYNHGIDAIRAAVFTKYNKPKLTGKAKASRPMVKKAFIA